MSFMLNLLLAFLILVPQTIAAKTKNQEVKRPKLQNYVQLIDNVGIENYLFKSNQQSYEVVFITPQLREHGHQYANYLHEKIVSKQKRKFADKPKKLARELSENKYQAIRKEIWDQSSDYVVLAIVPVIRREQTTFVKKSNMFSGAYINYLPFSNYKYSSGENHYNRFGISGVHIENKEGIEFCKAKEIRELPESSFTYYSQIYDGSWFFMNNSAVRTSYGIGNSGIIAKYDPKCLIQDGTEIIIENEGTKTASGKVKKKIKKQISEDFGL